MTVSVQPLIGPELLVRFARGEREAFVDVYRGRAPAVRRWVSRFFRSPFEQEEAAQEIWLTVHRMQTSFDVNRGALDPWLRVVAANRCRELLRVKGRRPDASVPLEDVDEAQWLDQPEATDPVLLSRLQRALAAFRATLSPDEVEVLEHGLIEEQSHESLAQKLGVNVRRSKYLKKKLIARVANDATFASLAQELP